MVEDLQLKKTRLTFLGNNPAEIIDENLQDVPIPTEEQSKIMQQVGKTIKAYRVAIEELLKGRYAHLKELAPMHLAQLGNIIIISCQEGIVIRFERKSETNQIFSAWMSQSLPEIAALVSQNLIQCHTERNYSSTVATTGIKVKLSTENPSAKTSKDILEFKIGFDAVIERLTNLPQSPQKP